MKPSDTFMGRILAALDTRPERAARIMGIRHSELVDMLDENRGYLAEVHSDPMWTRLADHVDRRIGELISIRTELGRKLAFDRKKQVAMRERIKARHL